MGGSEGAGVLLLEDDPATAELYALKLRLDGYAVHLAGDGTTADVIFERTHPDVVCVDSRLPDRPGTGVAERFAETGAIVILLTNDQDAYEHPPHGVARSLLKSRTNPSQLSATIRALVGARTAS